MISRRLAAILAALLVIVLLLGIGVALVQQRRIDGIVRQRDNAEAERDAAKQERDVLSGDAKVVTRYVDRVQYVREAGTTIVKEVPVYVTPEADRACPVPAGFVRVHDAAAENRPLAGPAGDADAAAAGIALSTVGATVADNYTTCHAIREQLIALQLAVSERQASIRD
ncbi:TPA: hypothetical protein ACKPZ9_000710 [Stenotrophomonas maltophilia]